MRKMTIFFCFLSLFILSVVCLGTTFAQENGADGGNRITIQFYESTNESRGGSTSSSSQDVSSSSNVQSSESQNESIQSTQTTDAGSTSVQNTKDAEMSNANQKKYPKTGEQVKKILPYLGVALIVLLVIVAFWRRRKS